MNIVVVGAGEVGQHTAEVLGALGHSITVVDSSREALQSLQAVLDVRTLRGSACHAEVLAQAGVENADLLVAATDQDEVNLLAASLGAAMGAQRTIARVHHSTYYESRGFDYAKHFGVDELICPEYLTSLAIARTLRNPGALAIEHFAKGRIEMQQLTVSDDSLALDVALRDVTLPPGARLAAVERGGTALLPTSETVLTKGDIITLIGDAASFEKTQKIFQTDKFKRVHVAIMGGTPIAVWLCRALTGKRFSIRLFERSRERAEELSVKLEHVTVMQADPQEPAVFLEEHLDKVDAFVAATKEDEFNILGAMHAKALGARTCMAVLEQARYLPILKHLGISHVFSPRTLAVKEIQRLVETGPMRKLATLAEGIADVFEVHPSAQAKAVGMALKEVKLPAGTIVAAIQKGEKIIVPGANDRIEKGDIVLVISRHGKEKELHKLFLQK